MKIEAIDVSIELNKKLIVSNANLKLEKGKFVGIIGPNGSGKSTLLKGIYRTNKIKSGKVLINGKDLNDISIKEFSKIVGVLGQFNNVAFDIPVLQMVLMGRNPHKGLLESDSKEDLDIALKALEKVGMLDAKNKSFFNLSGGEKQRVLLARVLAQEVDILILDEPTNHLDIQYQIQILNIVKELKGSVIVALHDLNLAAMYCDYIYVMNKGNIIKEGTPKEVLTKEFIKEVYKVDCKVYEEEEALYIRFKK
ncbi:ABC transporter ATP-binding protein [Clostridium thermobutyricum]|uniref:ABC transporter ATP-binding protein n=1 Tax=Clostridium thermobutyricum TaxID=29372 RepID=UPI002941CE05|nr:ABC transporter ATP-binding protein [Clostridium thermobutyricum]